MKIAFVHAESEFTANLSNELKGRLNDHELVSWVESETAPAHDFEVVVVMGKFFHEDMVGQTKLLLVHTVSAGYDSIDMV